MSIQQRTFDVDGWVVELAREKPTTEQFETETDQYNLRCVQMVMLCLQHFTAEIRSKRILI